MRCKELRQSQRKWFVTVLGLLGTVMMPALLNGQSQNGDILGTVRDSSGAVIVGAALSVEELQTGFRRATTSSADGTYRFTLVPKGIYNLTAEQSGFKRFTSQGIPLASNQVLRVDIELNVGEVSEEISVEGSAAAITTDTAGITTVKTQEFIDHHPARVFNVAPWMAAATVSATEGFMTFHGSRPQEGVTTKDGVQFSLSNHYVLGYSVQEVQAETLNAPAKYQTPVSVNTTTKQGTNQLHGKLEGTLVNNYFRAQNPRSHLENCSTSRPCNGYWQSGINIGGPVVIPKFYDGRDKTFWMFTYTPQKNFRNTRISQNLVPNDALRSGDLSGIPGLSLKDPLTGEPFAGNRIPAGRFSPVSNKLLSLYPRPDIPTGTSSTTTSEMPENVWDTWAVRIDQKLTNSNLFNFSFTRYAQKFSWDFADRSVVGYMGLANGEWKTWVLSFGDTHTFSPTVVNEARFGINHEGPTGYTASGKHIQERITELGLTGIPSAANVDVPVTGPDVRIPGFTPFLGWSSNRNNDNNYHFSDNLSIQKGKHTLQFGVDVRRVATNRFSAGPSAWPNYTFDGRFTGNSYGDFLLGLPGTISRTNVRPPVEARRNTYALYAQTDWRVSPQLTLNLGIRYDLITPQTEANGLHFNFNPKTGHLVVPSDQALRAIDPAWPISTNPVATANSAGFPLHLMNGDKNNLYPRIGFAFRPFNNQQTVIRGGYGIYVVPDGALQSSLLQAGGPFALSTTLDNSISNGVPLLQWPMGFATGGTFRSIPSVTALNPDWKYPYTQQWNLTVERDIAGQGLRLSYIGTKATKLGYMRDINKPVPSLTPFSPSRFIYPNYRNVNLVDNGGGSTYHAFESNLTLRNLFGVGITGELGYAWAKQLTDVAFWVFEDVRGNTIENPYCRTCERARAENVPLHRVYMAYGWNLPFGKGQKVAGSASGIANALIGNWLITSTVKARTGLGFTPVFTGADPSNTNTFGGRPDVVGNPRLSADVRNPDRWYNAGAFAPPPANASRFGNAGRNIVDGPGAFIMNLGIYKFFPVGEKTKITFSMTSDNILNKVNYSLGRAGDFRTPPINAANAGFLSSLAEDYSNRADNAMRQIYFSLGLEF